MVRLIHRTENAEKLIAYCARVSNPKNQESEKIEGLLNYCIKNGHWSIFEMASICFEVTTTRAIAQQLIRHRSLHFQEFSQRYAVAQDFEFVHGRRQDKTNRQNSIDDLSDEEQDWFLGAQEQVVELAHKLYYEALDKGIAKECARFLLPLSTTTKLYVHGTLRDFIHYINLRSANGTQVEHQEIALGMKKIFCEEFPTISSALNWTT